MSVVLADLGLRTAIKYVAAAYGVVWLLTLLWVFIVQSKLRRMQGQLDAAERDLAERRRPDAADAEDRMAVGR